MRKTRILAAILAAQSAWAAGSLFAQMPPNGGYPASAWNGYPFPAQAAQQPLTQPGFGAPTVVPQQGPAYQVAALHGSHQRCDNCAPVAGVSVGLCSQCQANASAQMAPAPVPAPAVVAAPAPSYMEGSPMMHEGAVSDTGCVADYNGTYSSGYTGGFIGSSRPRWFASAGGLVMFRDRPNLLNLSYISANQPYPPYIVLQSPDTKVQGGGEVNFGRFLGCRSAIFATYWGLAPNQVYQRYLGSQLGAGGLISSINDEVTPTMAFSDARTLDEYFDDSPEQRAFREYEIHNVEINYVVGTWGQFGGAAWPGCVGCGTDCGTGCGSSYGAGGMTGFSALQRGRLMRRGMGGMTACGGAGACGTGCNTGSCGYDACGGCDPCGPQRLRASLLMGVRFFRFDETLLFGSQADNGGAGWDANGGADHAFVSTRMVNNLVGFQMGAPVSWNVSDCFSLFAIPKFGIYGADVVKHARIYRGDGDEAFNRTYNKQDVSILSSLDLGGNVCWGPRWSVYGGYRVLSVAGLGLADNNMPRNVTVPEAWGQVYTNGSMILHGAFAGAQYSF